MNDRLSWSLGSSATWGGPTIVKKKTKKKKRKKLAGAEGPTSGFEEDIRIVKIGIKVTSLFI